MNIYWEPTMSQAIYVYYMLSFFEFLPTLFVLVVLYPCHRYRNWKIKVTKLLNGRARIPTQSFRMNYFLFIIWLLISCSLRWGFYVWLICSSKEKQNVLNFKNRKRPKVFNIYSLLWPRRNILFFCVCKMLPKLAI